MYKATVQRVIRDYKYKATLIYTEQSIYYTLKTRGECQSIDKKELGCSVKPQKGTRTS